MTCMLWHSTNINRVECRVLLLSKAVNKLYRTNINRVECRVDYRKSDRNQDTVLI